MNAKKTRPFIWMTVAAISLVGGSAGAADGVKLLKQPAVFPLAITQPGSYRLKTNLSVPTASTTAVVVSADNVSLDLNGFAILGPTICTPGTGPVTACSPTGAGAGIAAAGSNVTVRNGTVRGMGDAGIALTGIGAVVEDVRAVGNGGFGIQLGENCRVTGNTVTSNGAVGLVAGFHCIVSGNTVNYNALAGIEAAEYATISGNTVTQNGGEGITVDAPSGVITGNTVGQNRDGIIAAGYAVVMGNVVHDHAIEGIHVQGGVVKDNVVHQNANDGLVVQSDGLVADNAVSSNAAFGVVAGDASYANNTVVENNGGNANPQVDGGVEIGLNNCGGDTTCP